MFTGLIQALGQLQLLTQHQLQVTTAAAAILQDLAIGDSVAVDGVCLTVEAIAPQGFVVTISPETLERSTLAHQAATGGWVNLETSLRVGSKIGGHFVSGHVDGIGQVQQLVQTETAWEISFTAPPAIAPYLVLKGSIAVNGISLTVADCNAAGTWFQVAVIPHSFTTTNLHLLQPGYLVNLEGDLLGKYVGRLLQLPPLSADQQRETITPEFLLEHGFL